MNAMTTNARPGVGRRGRHRGRLVAGVAAVLFALTASTACTGSGGGGGGGAQAKAGVSLGPIRFAVKQDGSIDVALGANLATRRGSFGAEKGIEFARKGDSDKFLVVIRRPVNGETKEDVYEIDTENRLRVTSDGRIEEEISPHAVLITVAPGATINVEQISGSSSGGGAASARPPQPPREFAGSWTGRVAESPGSTGKNPGYTVNLTVNPDGQGDQVGTAAMPELRCAATLSVLRQQGAIRADRIVLRMDVTADPDDACPRESWVTLAVIPGGKLKYTHSTFQPSLTANAEPDGTEALLVRS